MSSRARTSPGLCPFVISLMPGRSAGRDLPHLLVLVHVGADQHGFGIDHLHDEDLVVVAVVGGDAGEPPALGALVPFVQVHLRVVALEGEQFVRVEPHGLLKFGQLLGVGELQGEGQQRCLVLFGVVVAVVDLQPRQAVQRVVRPLLDVRQEDHPVAGGDRVDEVLPLQVHPFEDGLHRGRRGTRASPSRGRTARPPSARASGRR